jgi:hypothetical protein
MDHCECKKDSKEYSLDCNANCTMDDGTASFIVFINDVDVLCSMLNLNSIDIKKMFSGDDFKYEKKVNLNHWIRYKIKEELDMKPVSFFCEATKENFLRLVEIQKVDLLKECDGLLNKLV